MRSIVLWFAFVGACGRGSEDPHPESRVHDDAAGLARVLSLPGSIRAARWTTRTQGTASPRVPGPTDEVVYGWVELGPGAPGDSGAAGSGRIPLDVARAILPAPVLARGRPVGPELELDGRVWDADRISRGAFQGSLALQVGEGLLVVAGTR